MQFYLKASQRLPCTEININPDEFCSYLCIRLTIRWPLLSLYLNLVLELIVVKRHRG